jgi:peroxiredoxin Q/BCP
MRDEFGAFRETGAQIVVVVREKAHSLRRYWSKHLLPFLCVPDEHGEVSRRYEQEWRLLKLGRLPALFVLNCEGKIAFAHYGADMKDIPDNREILTVLKSLAA